MSEERKSNHECNQRKDACVVRKSAGEIEVYERSGYNGVRHFGWCFSRNCHRGHHRFQAEASRVVDRHFRWNQQLVGASGQSSVEFALVAAGLLVVILAFGLLFQKLESGLFVQHALASASHHLRSLGSIADIFAY